MAPIAPLHSFQHLNETDIVTSCTSNDLRLLRLRTMPQTHPLLSIDQIRQFIQTQIPLDEYKGKRVLLIVPDATAFICRRVSVWRCRGRKR